jgi:hypothetical protein
MLHPIYVLQRRLEAKREYRTRKRKLVKTNKVIKYDLFVCFHLKQNWKRKEAKRYFYFSAPRSETQAKRIFASFRFELKKSFEAEPVHPICGQCFPPVVEGAVDDIDSAGTKEVNKEQPSYRNLSATARRVLQCTCPVAASRKYFSAIHTSPHLTSTHLTPDYVNTIILYLVSVPYTAVNVWNKNLCLLCLMNCFHYLA